MVEYLIGNFMVSSGMMTQEEYEKVLSKLESKRARLGLIAVNEGLLTVKQADEINFLQTVKDKRFGDIAVEKGLLTEEQVAGLLDKQGNEYLTFIQTLVDEGIVGFEEIDAVIKGYQIENGFSDDEIEVIKNADMDGIVKMYIPKDMAEYYQIALLAVKTFIRCVDRHVYIDHARFENTYNAVKPVSQELDGKDGIVSAIADNDGGMCKAASIFGRLELEELDEDVQDACGELLNCINGLYASLMSQDNVILELLPPELVDEKSVEDCFVLPISVCGKKLDFIVTKSAWR